MFQSIFKHHFIHKKDHMASIFKILSLSITLIPFNRSFAQVENEDSISGKIIYKPTINWQISESKKPFPTTKFVVPALLLTYGFTTTEIKGFKNVNEEVKEELYSEHPHKQVRIDNWLQFTPAAAIYGLNGLGIKSKDNLRDASMVFLLSNVFLNSTVYSLKNLTHKIRPDGSDNHSFPSGHTAEAFANAELLSLEYKDVSVWYGVAGYSVAAATGYLRMYNNKHWLGDVVAGAGIGIASTRLAWWLYPKMKHWFFKDKNSNTFILPSYQNGSVGIGIVQHL